LESYSESIQLAVPQNLIQLKRFVMNKLLVKLETLPLWARVSILAGFFVSLTLFLLYQFLPTLAGEGGFIPYMIHQIPVTENYSFSHFIWIFGAIIPLSWVYADIRANGFKRSYGYWISLAIVIWLGVYIGARVFHFGGPWGRGWFQWLGIHDLRGGGAVFYGGLIGIFLSSYVFLKAKKEKSIAKIFDFIAPAVALTSFTTRLLDCFFVGDDFGTMSTLPWAIQYLEGPHIYLLNQTVHPTQIYLALGNLLIFVLLLEIRMWKKWDGQVFVAYATLYAIMRFVLEFFRDTTESKASALTMLTYSQTISIAIFVIAVTYLFYKLRRKPS
jgi:phosphatidylglycerol:prolipoprotein diacylglycerol transferase